MWALVRPWLVKYGLQVAQWGAIALAILTALRGARSAGRNVERVETMRNQIENVKVRDEIRDTVSRAPVGDAERELREHWQRD